MFIFIPISIDKKPRTGVATITAISWAGGGIWLFVLKLGWTELTKIILCWFVLLALLSGVLIWFYRRESTWNGYVVAPFAKAILGLFWLSVSFGWLAVIWRLILDGYWISSIGMIFAFGTLWTAFRSFQSMIVDFLTVFSKTNHRKPPTYMN